MAENANPAPVSAPTPPNPSEPEKALTIYEFTVRDIDGKFVSMDQYKDKVLLIVNVASYCGLTKTNYKELNELYEKYGERGLVVIGFPCNQFMNQEPQCEVDIKEFAKKNGVTWPFMSKVNVNGGDADPVFKFLKAKLSSGLLMMGTSFIKWNFTKFLVNRQGVPVKRYEPTTAPSAFVKDIEKLLDNQTL